jgi:phosphinothricin acetyltransferase
MRSDAGNTIAMRRAGEADAEAIATIYNHEVVHGTGTLDEEPWHRQAALNMLGEHDDRFPLWVACLGTEIVGFCSLSRVRHRCGYRFAGETSVYTAPAHQRKGIGRLMLGFLESEARRIGFHTVLSRITGENVRSIALFESCGHVRAGLEREVGFKFGRRIDVAIYQKML